MDNEVAQWIEEHVAARILSLEGGYRVLVERITTLERAVAGIDLRMDHLEGRIRHNQEGVDGQYRWHEHLVRRIEELERLLRARG